MAEKDKVRKINHVKKKTGAGKKRNSGSCRRGKQRFFPSIFPRSVVDGSAVSN